MTSSGLVPTNIDPYFLRSPFQVKTSDTPLPYQNKKEEFRTLQKLKLFYITLIYAIIYFSIQYLIEIGLVKISKVVDCICFFLLIEVYPVVKSRNFSILNFANENMLETTENTFIEKEIDNTSKKYQLIMMNEIDINFSTQILHHFPHDRIIQTKVC